MNIVTPSAWGGMGRGISSIITLKEKVSEPELRYPFILNLIFSELKAAVSAHFHRCIAGMDLHLQSYINEILEEQGFCGVNIPLAIHGFRCMRGAMTSCSLPQITEQSSLSSVKHLSMCSAQHPASFGRYIDLHSCLSMSL